MFWRKKAVECHDLYSTLPPEHKASIEIVASKDAKQEAIEQVKKANEHLKEVFDKNHFTIKIYLAAGGKETKKPRTKKKGNNGS